MKTIGYIDRGDGNKKLYEFVGNPQLTVGQSHDLFLMQKRVERIRNALNDLRGVGNIAVYLIDGKKARKLFVKGL
jgi:hypothetical protein